MSPDIRILGRCYCGEFAFRGSAWASKCRYRCLCAQHVPVLFARKDRQSLAVNRAACDEKLGRFYLLVYNKNQLGPQTMNYCKKLTPETQVFSTQRPSAQIAVQPAGNAAVVWEGPEAGLFSFHTPIPATRP